MDDQLDPIPVILFVYARPTHLCKTLASLKEDGIPKLCIFSDGPRTPDKDNLVSQVRSIIRKVDWCDVEIVERSSNLGLGKSIVTGMTEIFSKYDSAIVFEDDLVCVKGTYNYLCQALRQYASCAKVMSVTGWTHSRIRPASIKTSPYFDGRAPCWTWGTWSRVWRGMSTDAMSLLSKCETAGLDVCRFGADLQQMAKEEIERNIWAVRFCYLHMLQQGLCFRPPWSMVENVGFDIEATNSAGATEWLNPPLRSAPPVPEKWPEPAEHPECAILWQKACGYPSTRSFRKQLIELYQHFFSVK